MAPRSTRDKRQVTDADSSQNGDEIDVASFEKELAALLTERIKPGLNRGSVPLLARSIAKEMASRQGAEASDEYESEADDEDGDDSESSADLETQLHKLQEQIGDDWVLYFSVHGGHAWLTAEKEDASQRVEAPTASVLAKAVKLLNDGGGRAGK
jgi:hypothetical protein